MKKLLLLGGSAQQVIAIENAKKTWILYDSVRLSY